MPQRDMVVGFIHTRVTGVIGKCCRSNIFTSYGKTWKVFCFSISAMGLISLMHLVVKRFPIFVSFLKDHKTTDLY